jgi:hypothetical protein
LNCGIAPRTSCPEDCGCGEQTLLSRSSTLLDGCMRRSPEGNSPRDIRLDTVSVGFSTVHLRACGVQRNSFRFDVTQQEGPSPPKGGQLRRGRGRHDVRRAKATPRSAGGAREGVIVRDEADGRARRGHARRRATSRIPTVRIRLQSVSLRLTYGSVA